MKKRELRVLKQIDLFLHEPAAQLRKIRRYVWGCRITGWLAFLIAYMLMQRSYDYSILALLIAVLGGVGMGYAISANLSLLQWPILRPHINNQSLRARIAELEK